jgi:hypothetical protein
MKITRLSAELPEPLEAFVLLVCCVLEPPELAVAVERFRDVVRDDDDDDDGTVDVMPGMPVGGVLEMWLVIKIVALKLSFVTASPGPETVIRRDT